jgi:nucleotide-binding universal stress UspA family protein
MVTAVVKTAELIQLKNILYPTDFSRPSELALPFAAALARAYGATVHALHVLTPIITGESGVSEIAIEAEVASASRFMHELDSQLAGTEHQTSIENAFTVWEAVDKAIREHSIDLVVMGTHGRTGVRRLLLGSVVENVFRSSPCPVMTVGPACRASTHAAGRLRRILFATDYSAASAAAAPYAISLAESNRARLLLVHVTPAIERRKRDQKCELSVAEMIHRLYDIVPDQAHLSIPPEVSVEYGSPAERIVEVAEQRSTDLIVLGVRNAHGHLGTATHLEPTTAHEIVARACCPVLTVRE